ncbi:hypothetical protein E4U14_000020 [Claviceps sp. LM454 group G7]|nr:hypothetical protein E4U14_000020 [Claviceps sp. LM454 group G7]
MRRTYVPICMALCVVLAHGATPALDHCASINPVLSCSCSATPRKAGDTCCTETYGGLLVATQLWSTFTGRESEGQVYAKNSWSIHGLWPDFCNGSYTQYCDLSRQYDPKPSPNTTNSKPGGVPVPPYTGEPIDAWFAPHGKLSLLFSMNKHWPPNSSPHDDLFTFFETVLRWHRTLPTFQWLLDAGIHPSNTTSYTYAAIQAALTRTLDGQRRPPAFIGCGGPRFNETLRGRGSLDSGRTELNEIWYYFHVRGRPQRGEGRRVHAGDAGGRLTTCAMAEGAVRYLQRTEGSEK